MSSKERLRINSQRWRDAHRNTPRYRAQVKANRANQRANEFAADGRIDADFLLSLLVHQTHKCANPMCCADITNDYTVDHIIPLLMKGPNKPFNIQLLCPTCSVKKQAKHPAKWLKSVGLPCPEVLELIPDRPRKRSPRKFSPEYLAAQAARQAADKEPGIRNCAQCDQPKLYPTEFCKGTNHRVCLKCKREYLRQYDATHIRKSRRKPGEGDEKPVGKHRPRLHMRKET